MIQRRAFLAAGLTGLASMAARSVRAAASGLTGALSTTSQAGQAARSGSPARFVIGVSGPAAAKGWGPLTAELQKRGFPSTLVSTADPLSSFTPNETRAGQIVSALKDVQEPVVIVGISNEGCVLPLVAAARPVRRLVYINATIPRPGKAFIEIGTSESVAVPGSILDKLIKGSQLVTDEFLKLRADPHPTPEQWQAFHDHIHASQYARSLPNFYEVCSLDKMPAIDSVDISGAADDQIRPEWEQATARRALGVEPTIISSAGHVTILADQYVAQVADACVQGL